MYFYISKLFQSYSNSPIILNNFCTDFNSGICSNKSFVNFYNIIIHFIIK